MATMCNIKQNTKIRGVTDLKLSKKCRCYKHFVGKRLYVENFQGCYLYHNSVRSKVADFGLKMGVLISSVDNILYKSVKETGHVLSEFFIELST